MRLNDDLNKFINMYEYFVPTFELIAAILATIFYKKYEKSSEKYFLHFLWFTFFIDAILGNFISEFLKINNYWLLNIYMLLSFVFYFNWYRIILKSKRLKLIITILSLLFVIFALYNFRVKNWEEYHTNTFIFGAFINLITSIAYFLQLLGSRDIIHVEYKLSFWIATGLLLFNICMIPFFIFSDLLSSREFLYQIILVSLNAILYTCYSVGFIWNKKEYNQY